MIERIKKIFCKKKKRNISFIFLLFVFLFFPIKAHAFLLGIEDIAQGVVLKVFGIFLELITMALGYLLTMGINFLVVISSYNTFIDEPSIKYGWEILLSMSNMFFILIILIIAFANILRIESYNLKNTLPKVVIMAVLVNFSLMICGLAIDLAQIIMKVFVEAIGTSGGNYFDALEVKKYFDVDFKTGEEAKQGLVEVKFIETAVSMILAMAFMFVAVVTVFTAALVLLARIIMLWVYTILSPLAFLLAAFPGGKKYASQWADGFTKNLVSGPVLMFFIWLGLYIASADNVNLNNTIEQSGGDKSFGLMAIMQTGDFINLMIVIGMFMGGLVITSQVGGAAGGMANKGMNTIQRGKGWVGGQVDRAGKWGLRKTGEASWGTAKAGGRMAKFGGGTVDRWVGQAVSKATGKGEQSIAKTGLVSQIGRVKNIPSYFKDAWTNNLSQHSDYKKKQFEASENIAEHGFHEEDGIKYVKDHDSDKIVREDDRNKVLEKGGQGVAMMGAAQRAMHDASMRSSSKAAGIKKEKEKELVEKEIQSLKGQDYNDVQLRRVAKDLTISEKRRKAANMLLSEKGAFTGKTDKETFKAKEEAQKSLGNNNFLVDQFKNNVREKRPELLYNMRTDDGKNKFSRDVARGKIDYNKMSPDAFENEHVMEGLEKALGKSFGSAMQKLASQNKEMAEKIGKGIKESKNSAENAGDDKKWKQMAKMQFKATGDIENSFANKDGSRYDYATMGNALRSSDAKDLNNVDTEKLNSIMSTDEGRKNVGNNISYSQLKRMTKAPDAESENIRAFRDAMVKWGDKKDDQERQKTKEDVEISSV